MGPADLQGSQALELKVCLEIEVIEGKRIVGIEFGPHGDRTPL